ncbi:head-tail adaptor protein [Pseudoxanthomonas winnipegensis]|uniref:Head-tail adaptor protein n=1 Tax=Pseudoxanthomonas winnipegensis TaxID=2480810 RepID=A0ABY1WCQ4_9GAMM|nr:phage head closure protein [Pseudoxanthomonas winnipegensis]TAA12475.1 head-tail adaptor protein [Pseudoxanthomonas winnipegensis]TAA19160.1 head-tail adaptor protein [Pseudoxanthomonas winnipegensis]TAH70421.1 head-tail adaptor protein [Pseudoxanthomonas winnipegensis]
MGLAAGELNRRITIQARGTGTDDAGQPLDTWTDLHVLWANIRGQTGMGSITGLQDNVPASIERYSFRIRFREGITDAMRVLYKGVAFDIRQVRMDFDRREWTDLVCEQGGTNG